MEIVRYVRPAQPGSDQAPEFTDVLRGPGADRADLDKKMERMGYVYFGVVDPNGGAGPPWKPLPVSTTPRGPSPVPSVRQEASAPPSSSLPKPAIASAVPLSTAVERSEPEGARVVDAAHPAQPDASVVAQGVQASRDDTRSAASAAVPNLVEDKIALVVVVVAALLVHSTVVQSNFRDDDFLHLYASGTLEPGAFLMKLHGGHFMGLHKLLLLGLRELFGLAPAPYFAVALVTHALNVALLYRVLRYLAGPTLLAGAAALVWGCAPVHADSLSWFSVYGAVLSTTFALVALLELARARAERRPLSKGALVRGVVALFLGASCVSGGVVTALAFPLVGWLVLPPEAQRGRAALVFGGAALLIFVSYLTITADNEKIPHRNVAQFFTALLVYGGSAIAAGPFFTVTDQGMGLFGESPRGLMMAANAAAGVLLLSLLVYGSRRTDSERRQLIVSMLALSVAGYGAVALGRGAFAEGDRMLKMAVSGRYHYAQTLGLLLAVAIAGGGLLQSRRVKGRARLLLVGSGLLYVLLSARVAAHAFSRKGDDNTAFVNAASKAIRAAAASAAPDADVYVQNIAFWPLSLAFAMGEPKPHFPGIGAYWLLAHGAEPLDGRRIRFVENDPKLLAEIRRTAPADWAAHFVSPTVASGAGASVHSLSEVRGKATLSEFDRAAIGKALRESKDPKVKEALREAIQRERAAKGAPRKALQGPPAEK